MWLFKVLLCHSQFLRPQIGQITHLQITVTQKDQNYLIFFLFFLTLTWLRERLQPALLPSWQNFSKALNSWFKFEEVFDVTKL